MRKVLEVEDLYKPVKGDNSKDRGGSVRKEHDTVKTTITSSLMRQKREEVFLRTNRFSASQNTNKKSDHFEIKTTQIHTKNRLLGKDDFENEILEGHNEHRRKHGCPPLKLNKNISKVSKQWAEELAKRDQAESSNNREYGESIFCGSSNDPRYKVTANEVMSKWYDQIIDHSFGSEPKYLKAGQFSQMIWKDSTEIGVGMAKSKSGKVYVVVNYNPPGNIGGQFATKVPPPGFLSMGPPAKVQTRHPESRPSKPDKDEKRSSGLSEMTKKLKNLTSGGDDVTDFEKECLAAHNEYRAKHGVPPLKLNKKISKYSEDWAKHLTTLGKMEHRQQNEYGENIFYSWSSDPNHMVNGRQPVDSWYSEIKDHTFGREPTSMKSGHFTQVIWQDSKELGVAWAKDKTGRIYVVANYLPPGNFVGTFAVKVPPPLRN